MAQSQTVVITNVECGQNLVDDRSNLDVVTLRRPNDLDKLQQWIQITKEDGYCFKNVGSGAYLCVDDNPTNPDGVIAIATKQFKWLLHQVKNVNNVTHWRIRPFSAATSVNSKYIKMEGQLKPVKLGNWRNDNKYLWEITPIQCTLRGGWLNFTFRPLLVDAEGQNSAVMSETRITHVECDQNLGVGCSSLDVVSLRRGHETDRLQIVAITNVECEQSLGVGPSNDDVVTLYRPDETSKFQQWVQFQKGDNAICFKNVGSGAYLCEDTNPTNPGGVRVDLIKQFKWKVQRLHHHWTIRPFSASEKSKNLRMESELKPVELHTRRGNANTYMWDITTVFPTNEI